MTQALSDEAAFRNADAFRDLAASKMGASLPDKAEHGDHLLNPDFRKWVMDRAIKPAAVLIPVVERNKGLDVILTKRMEHLNSHSGQVAFPGGKIDDTDANAAAAALREAHEEVGMEPGQAEVIGSLPDYYTGSGYRITPVIALVDPAAKLEANPEEVDYVFEVPLAFLMDPVNHKRGSREFYGARRYYYEMPYGSHYIWGVTAGIIAMMHARLFT